jgi:hypothetical protein
LVALIEAVLDMISFFEDFELENGDDDKDEHGDDKHGDDKWKGVSRINVDRTNMHST